MSAAIIVRLCGLRFLGTALDSTNSNRPQPRPGPHSQCQSALRCGGGAARMTVIAAGLPFKLAGAGPRWTCWPPSQNQHADSCLWESMLRQRRLVNALPSYDSLHPALHRILSVRQCAHRPICGPYDSLSRRADDRGRPARGRAVSRGPLGRLQDQVRPGPLEEFGSHLKLLCLIVADIRQGEPR